MPDLAAGTKAQPLPSAELNLGGTSTSEAQFLTASAFGATASGQPLVCPLPGSNTLKNRAFRVRAWGRMGSAVATNFTAKVYFGTSSTISSNTALATTGAIGSAAGASMNCTWGLELEGAHEATTGSISGLFRGWVNKTVVAQAVFSNTATVNAVTEGQGFTITGQFATGTASNLAFVDGFECIVE